MHLRPMVNLSLTNISFVTTVRQQGQQSAYSSDRSKLKKVRVELTYQSRWKTWPHLVVTRFYVSSSMQTGHPGISWKIDIFTI